MRSRCSTTTSWTGRRRAGAASPRTVPSPCCTSAEHWRGDADWFGTSAAILAGDLDVRLGRPAVRLRRRCRASIDRARRAFNTLRAEVMAGQYLDLRLAARTRRRRGRRPTRRIAEIRPVHRYPTAGARPAPRGRAGFTRVSLPALAAYGDAVGIAFQLRDDVLGLFGDPGGTGKRPRPTICARASARCSSCGRCGWPDRPARRLLEAALGDPALDDGDADRCREIVAAMRCARVHRDAARRGARSRGGRRARAGARTGARRARGSWRRSRSGGSMIRDTRVARPVVVIGAGLGGLAAACHLAGRGHDVVVVEAGDGPGRRAGRVRDAGATGSTPARPC